MKKAFAAFLVLCMIMIVFSASAGSAGAEPDPGQQEQAAGDDSAEEKTGWKSAFSRLKERVSDAVSEAPAALSSLGEKVQQAMEPVKDRISEASEALSSMGGKVQQALEPVKEKIDPLITELKDRMADSGAPEGDEGAEEEKAECGLTWGGKRERQSRQGPRQHTVDFWDGVFGTWGDGISLADDPVDDGLVVFGMELPDPVSMPETYSVSYTRQDKEEQEVITTLERDAAGNIHYVDGDKEQVFVRTGNRYRGYTVSDGRFIPWSDVSLSARTVRQETAPFWNCADQTFMKWLGMDVMGETEYLGRSGSLCHAEPGTITFTYKSDMIMDDETGICLTYSADELLKGAALSVTEDNKIRIDIKDYDIGGEEMNFSCTRFETENISFVLPCEQ